MNAHILLIWRIVVIFFVFQRDVSKKKRNGQFDPDRWNKREYDRFGDQHSIEWRGSAPLNMSSKYIYKNLQLDVSARAPSSWDSPSFTARLALLFDSGRVVGDEAPRPKDDQQRTEKECHAGRQRPSHQLNGYCHSQICGHVFFYSSDDKRRRNKYNKKRELLSRTDV